jgi:transposase
VNLNLENSSKSELIALIKSKDIRINNQGIQIDNQEIQIDNQEIIISESQSKINYLKFQIKELQRLVFGTKRERFEAVNNPFQAVLPFDVEENTTITETVKEKISYEREKTTKREHPGRLPLPAHLPVEEIIIEPNEDTTGMVIIGKEITDELELTPAKFFIKRTIRPKYANPEQGIFIAEMPSRPIDKCIAGNGLLSQIMVDKFVDHLPFYRQIERFRRDKIEIKASTIDGWQTAVCKLLVPLYDELKKQVLRQGYLQADESPIKVLDRNKKGKTHQGYYWVYHSPIEKMLFFDYQHGRGHEGPEDLLKNFKGYLQTDGYVVYDAFAKKENIILVGCMAHARRYFEKALEDDKIRASIILEMIQQLYAIERKIREEKFTHAQRHTYRLDHSEPIMLEIIKWLLGNRDLVVPKSPTGKAIHYMISRWEYIRAFMFDGSLEIDNNLIENKIRPMVIGRKNYLFAGSHNGAERAAMFYSFFGTCKLHNVNPHQWLKKVLEVISDYKVSKLSELLPQNFKLDSI